MRKKNLFLFLGILSSIHLYGQNKLFLKIYPENHIFQYKKEFTDTLSLNKELFAYFAAAHSEGYLLASVDSSFYATDTFFCYISLFEKFKWSSLRKGNLNDLLLSKTGFSEKFYRDRVFKNRELAAFEKKVIQVGENNGYPFCSINLDSIRIEDNSISGSFFYDPGPLIHFDSIKIVGSSKIRSKYLERYLGILPGKMYEQQKIDHIHKALKKLPFLEEEKPSLLIFRDNKAKVVLFLKEKKSNYIDGIIGFLPNQGSNKKLLLTGQANLLLQNLFGTGKKLNLAWKKFNLGSQTLNISYFHPALLGSSLDLSMNLNFLKQDSSFLNLDRGLKIGQTIKSASHLNVFMDYKSSRILSPKSSLGHTADFDFLQYGVTYNFNNLDDNFFPHKGWRINVSAGIGNKKIRNDTTSKADPGQSISPHSVQTTGEFQIERFNKISKSTSLLIRGIGGGIYNNKHAYLYGDLFRIGGLMTLRGFNEKNFYAQSYVIGTLELRYFPERTSYFSLFIDQGYIRNSLSALKQDLATGFGAGISFISGPGVFSFIYSLGTTSQQKLAFNLSKIHFGFTSKF